MTLSEFYAYKLHVRPDTYFISLQYGKALFHQYIVDAYLKVEANNLNYYRTHQKELRIEKYSGLMDYVNSCGNYDIGKTVILPSSFTVIKLFFKFCIQSRII